MTGLTASKEIVKEYNETLLANAMRYINHKVYIEDVGEVELTIDSVNCWTNPHTADRMMGAKGWTSHMNEHGKEIETWFFGEISIEFGATYEDLGNIKWEMI